MMVERVLGVDLGDKRIGVAVSTGTLAVPYDTVHRSGDRRADHRRLAELVAETGAHAVVVGLPLSLDGTEGRAARKARTEIEQLAGTLGVPVDVWDERLTTVTAERALKAQALDARERRNVVDKVAASVILQSWLDAQPPEPSSDGPSPEPDHGQP